ncbi:MAG: hypothetical protein RIQ49_1456 [Pseudomonadota bacterium]
MLREGGAVSLTGGAVSLTGGAVSLTDGAGSLIGGWPFTGFVGLDLLQSAIIRWCLMNRMLYRAGIE